MAYHCWPEDSHHKGAVILKVLPYHDTQYRCLTDVPPPFRERLLMYNEPLPATFVFTKRYATDHMYAHEYAANIPFWITPTILGIARYFIFDTYDNVNNKTCYLPAGFCGSRYMGTQALDHRPQCSRGHCENMSYQSTEPHSGIFPWSHERKNLSRQHTGGNRYAANTSHCYRNHNGVPYHICSRFRFNVKTVFSCKGSPSIQARRL